MVRFEAGNSLRNFDAHLSKTQQSSSLPNYVRHFICKGGVSGLLLSTLVSVTKVGLISSEKRIRIHSALQAETLKTPQ